MNFTQRLQWHQDSRWQSANNTGRHPKPLESIIQEAIWGTKGLYRPYQVWGNHLHSHKITFTFPGREGNCSKQAQTGKGTWYNVTDELINEVATVHLVSLHKTCQWANGKQGTGQVPVQINLHSLSQPATHERKSHWTSSSRGKVRLLHVINCLQRQTTWATEKNKLRRIREGGREYFCFYLMR